MVRTDKAVYGLGETVQVTVRSTNAAANVYVDWLNGGQIIDMRTLQATDGQVTFSMPVDASLAGSNRIEAYVVDADGNIVRAGRTVFARSHGALRVDLAADKPQYAPGEPAKLSFHGMSDAAFEAEAGKVEAAWGRRPAFGGFVFHHYEGYRRFVGEPAPASK